MDWSIRAVVVACLAFVGVVATALLALPSAVRQRLRSGAVGSSERSASLGQSDGNAVAVGVGAPAAIVRPGGVADSSVLTSLLSVELVPRFSIDYDPSMQTLHIGVFLAITVVLLVVGYWILSTRQTRGARLFAATLLLASLRTGLDVVHVVVGDFWSLHRSIAIGGVVVNLVVVLVFLRFAGRYADEPILTGARARLASIALVGLAALAVASDPLHGAFLVDVTHNQEPFVHVTMAFGPLGWALFGVTVLGLLVGAGLLARSFTVAKQPDWWSAAMLTMGICLTAVVVVSNLLGQLPLAAFEYSGVAIAGFLLLTTPALLGHGLRRIEISARESMLRELDDPIVIVDDKRTIVDYTAATERLLPEQAAGKPFEAVFEHVPEWPPAGATVTTEVDLAELVGADVDLGVDAPEHFLVQTSPVTSETGDVIGYTVRFADVTDLKRRTAELARKNEQLDQFANTISHDLREPMAVASEYVALLEEAVDSAAPDGTLDSETVHYYLETIDQSLERMRHIIDDLLALARNTDPVSDVRTISFGEAVQDAWTLVDPGTGRLHVDGGGTIEADRECLQRIFENLFRLVATAREPAGSGASDGVDGDTDAIEVLGRDVQIVTGLTDDGFYCTADGPGLPDDVSEITLEQVESAGAGQRSLELSIVDHLVDAHGWTFSVDSEGSGVRFECSGCVTSSEDAIAGDAD